MQSGDGIYTATILRECIRNNGRHSSKVLITGTAETVATLYFSSRSAMIGKKTAFGLITLTRKGHLVA